jgi:hypothetical protein
VKFNLTKRKSRSPPPPPTLVASKRELSLSSKRSAKSRALEALSNQQKQPSTKASSLANATANKSTVDLFGKTKSSLSNTNDLEEIEGELSDQERDKSNIDDEGEEPEDYYEESIDIDEDEDIETNEEKDEAEEEEDEEEEEESESSKLFRPFKKIRSSARAKSGNSDFSSASSRHYSNHQKSNNAEAINDLDSETKSNEKSRLRKQSNSSNRSLSKVESPPATSSRTVVPHKKARLSTDLPWTAYSAPEIEKSN